MVKLILMLGMVLSLSTAASAETSMTFPDQTELGNSHNEGIKIKTEGQSVYIYGATGQKLEVVSLTGKIILTIRIDSPAQRVDLNIPKGCYILRIGKTVRKVSIH